MEIIAHRINTIKGLQGIPREYGTEIDIRGFGSEMILNHEPFQNGDKLENYLDQYYHGTLVLNIKEAGIEDEVLRLVRQRPQIKSYFLLDVEFSYLYRASRQGVRNIAIRFSEDESIETVNKYVDRVDWVWIDTNTQLPLDENNIHVLNRFKKCLVCPERWSRPSDIKAYKKELDRIDFKIDAVMTALKYKSSWIR